MNLQDNMTAAVHISREIIAHLRDGDWEAATAHLAERDDLLRAVATGYEDATEAEKEACGSILTELRAVDGELQHAGQSARDAAAGEWQRSLGQAPAPRHDYDRAPELACLDRLA